MRPLASKRRSLKRRIRIFRQICSGFKSQRAANLLKSISKTASCGGLRIAPRRHDGQFYILQRKERKFSWSAAGAFNRTSDHETAVGTDDLAGDEVRRLRSEKQGGLRDVVGSSQPEQGRHFL